MKTLFTIFMAEDDESTREYISIVLERAGFNVFTATNCRDALTQLRALEELNLPDLILTDVQMPYDGQSLIEHIRQLVKVREIPVIPMSASGLLEVGGLKIFPKPLNMRALVSRIRETILQNRLSRRLDESLEIPGPKSEGPKLPALN